MPDGFWVGQQSVSVDEVVHVQLLAVVHAGKFFESALYSGFAGHVGVYASGLFSANSGSFSEAFPAVDGHADFVGDGSSSAVVEQDAESSEFYCER